MFQHQQEVVAFFQTGPINFRKKRNQEPNHRGSKREKSSDESDSGLLPDDEPTPPDVLNSVPDADADLSQQRLAVLILPTTAADAASAAASAAAKPNEPILEPVDAGVPHGTRLDQPLPVKSDVLAGST